MRRFLPLVLIAILAAGCGSGSKSGQGGGSIPAGSSEVRAGLLAFVSVDSDLGSDQWQQVDDLSQKFPGRGKALAHLKQELAKENVDYQRDVDPALGPELDIAVVSGGTEATTQVAGLTKPDDPEKFKALVTKLNRSDSSGDNAVYREVDGWYFLADSQAAISAVLRGDKPALIDDDNFREANGKLTDDALVKAYLDGPRLRAIVSSAAAQDDSGFDPTSFGLDKLKYVSAAASAEDDGVRVHGASSGAQLGADFTAKLVEGVPADAFALLDFQGKGTTDQLGDLKSNPQVGPAIAQIERVLGVPFDQVLALLSGEVAFYARPGAAIPELTLVLDPPDKNASMETLDKLATRLAQATGAKIETGSQGGHAVKTLNFGQFAVHWGGADDKILITSGVNGIAEYGAGDHLSDSADFKEATDAAGMPDSTGGFMYINLKDALPLIEGFATLAGESLPSDVTENLRPLRSFLAWSEGSGDTRTFDAFLEIK